MQCAALHVRTHSMWAQKKDNALCHVDDQDCATIYVIGFRVLSAPKMVKMILVF